MSNSIDRRQFMARLAGGTAAAMTALSYSRIFGANDRISIGIIGCGDRGTGAHMPGVHKHSQVENVEITAVCDPWRIAREKAGALVREWYGREARQFVSYRDLMALDDVDAVMIASCDHQHTTHLEAAAKAGKDAYVEKPLGMELKRVKKAVDAVKNANIVVQVGTQLRSLPTFTGCKKLYETGIFGMVSRIEQCRNSEQPYWYRYVKKEIKLEDVDWNEFLMHRRKRPFDPVLYSGWYGYRDFSNGPVPGLGSHYIDLVHYITGAEFPISCVCLGGTFTWKDENNFTAPDHVQAIWTYPDFMVSYSTNFGNGYGNVFNLYGDQGVMKMVHWGAPVYTAEGGSRNKGVIRGSNDVEQVERPDHFLDWLQCLRTRGQPNASIEAGYQHAVAVIMAMKSFDTGERTHYDPEKRKIKND